MMVSNKSFLTLALQKIKSVVEKALEAYMPQPDADFRQYRCIIDAEITGAADNCSAHMPPCF